MSDSTHPVRLFATDLDDTILGVPLENVLVAGAGANNGSMFALAGVRGILVGNASGELFAVAGRFKALITREKMADGVLAGLNHFGVIEAAGQPAASPIVDAASVA